MSLDSILPKLDEEEKKYVEDLIANLEKSHLKSYKLLCENGNLKKIKQDQVKRSNELEKEKIALQRKHRLLNVEISKVITENI